MKTGRFLLSTLSALVFSFVASATFVNTAEAARSPYFEAKIFDLKDREKHMFNYKSEIETEGASTIFHNSVTDLEGKLLVVEKTVMKTESDGRQTLVSFEQEQKQLETSGRLDVVDGKILFSFTRAGKTKTDDESLESEFIVTSTLVPFIRSNWDRLMKGETVKARLGVLDRMESIGFQFKKESEKEIAGQMGMVIKMNPSSIIISALVNPLRLGFQADGARILEVEGRTNVKVMVDGKYKDFDGLTVYSYPAPVVSPATPAQEKSVPSAKRSKSKPATKK